jgi:hypothetical protein
VSGLAENKGIDIDQYLAERVSESEKQSEAARTSLRDTAKWIISGIAVATAGVIAGTSLSSLGALDIGGRFFAAVAAAALGYVGLGYLFASALAVIVPRDHTLQEIADGTDISARWQREIEKKIQPMLWPAKIKTLKEFVEYASGPKNDDGTPLLGKGLVTFNMARRWIEARAKSVERELQFRRLKRRTFAITPLIALAFIGFSWAANPKEQLRRVPTIEKIVEVNQDDIATLRSALANAACVVPKLRVIVLAEWPSGVQDVVTVPAPDCPPVRLRLDHGRFSQAQ